MWIEIFVRVDLGCDPEAVETIVADEVRLAREALPTLRDEPPAIRFRLGESALEVRTHVPIVNFVDRSLLTHTLVKRLLVRLRREGLVVPMPQRVLHVHPAAEGPSAPPRQLGS
jgi:small-conductance mechanosensitive channel